MMECVEAFIQCAATKTSQPPRVVSKAKAHAFLSVMPVLVTSVGIGAKNGYWNFEHDCMANVVDFLRQFAVVAQD
ncbi:hypothetical protein [Acididesulfobacillus acetoxydans]|nr:hypothetical protein [Acididesulfobacillus acetoxydans]